MKNAGSTVVAIILGAAGLLVASGAHAGGPKPVVKANKAPKAKARTPKAAVAPAPAEEHCALDDLGFDSMLAKKSDAPVVVAPKRPAVDTIAKSKAAADSWDLGRKSRDASRPSGEIQVKTHAKTLSAGAVGAVVADKLSDLEYCLASIPEAERGSEQFTLHLVIAPKGNVVSSSVGGNDDAARIGACVQAQVKRWTFPQAEAQTELDYPLSFHVEHIDG
jgi:hypothetical protein